MTSNRSCYYKPGGGLTRCRNVKVKGGGKGHKHEQNVGIVAVAWWRILVLEVKSVMGVKGECRPKGKDWTAYFSPMPIRNMQGKSMICTAARR